MSHTTKLSQLQQLILKAAWANIQNRAQLEPLMAYIDGRRDEWRDLFNFEVAILYFGIGDYSYDSKEGTSYRFTQYPHDWPSMRRWLDLGVPDTRPYNRAHASISRAIKNLAKRGLVSRCVAGVHKSSGLDLLPAGINAADSLVSFRNFGRLLTLGATSES